MKPADFPHPDDYAKAFALAHPGYFPTYFSSLCCGWEIEHETEKAVKVGGDNWLPKSQVLIDGRQVTGVKSAFYNRIKRTAARHFGG